MGVRVERPTARCERRSVKPSKRHRIAAPREVSSHNDLISLIRPRMTQGDAYGLAIVRAFVGCNSHPNLGTAVPGAGDDLADEDEVDDDAKSMGDPRCVAPYAGERADCGCCCATEDALAVARAER